MLYTDTHVLYCVLAHIAQMAVGNTLIEVAVVILDGVRAVASTLQSCGHDGLRELVGPLWTKELLPDLSEELARRSELALRHLLKHRLGFGFGSGSPSQAAAGALRPLACGARRGHASVTSVTIRVGGKTALGGPPGRWGVVGCETGGRRCARL